GGEGEGGGEGGDGVRVVDDGGGLHVDEDVVVQEVEEAARAHRLGDVHAATMHALARVRHDATLDEGYRRFHQERVDAEVPMIAEGFQHGLRNRADADLDGGAVGNQVRHVPADRALEV